MSWWTEVRDETLKSVGLDTPQNVVSTAGAVVAAAVQGGNEIKKEAPIASKNVFQSLAEKSNGKIAGVSLPIILVALGAGYFLLRRR